MILGPDVVILELILISSLSIYVQVYLFVFDKFGSFYAVNAHIMLNSALEVEFVLLLAKILFVDGHSSLARNLEFDVFWFPYVLSTN